MAKIPDAYNETFRVGDVVNIIGEVVGINLDGNGGITVHVNTTGTRLTVSRFITPETFELRARPKKVP
jgi:hypothetical protein